MIKINRTKFGVATIVLFILSMIIINWIDQMSYKEAFELSYAESADPMEIVSFLFMQFLLPLYIVFLVFLKFRLNDLNKGVISLIIGIIPIINIYILAVALFKKGEVEIERSST